MQRNRGDWAEPSRYFSPGSLRVSFLDFSKLFHPYSKSLHVSPIVSGRSSENRRNGVTSTGVEQPLLETPAWPAHTFEHAGGADAVWSAPLLHHVICMGRHRSMFKLNSVESIVWVTVRFTLRRTWSLGCCSDSPVAKARSVGRIQWALGRRPHDLWAWWLCSFASLLLQRRRLASSYSLDDMDIALKVRLCFLAVNQGVAVEKGVTLVILVSTYTSTCPMQTNHPGGSLAAQFEVVLADRPSAQWFFHGRFWWMGAMHWWASPASIEPPSGIWTSQPPSRPSRQTASFFNFHLTTCLARRLSSLSFWRADWFLAVNCQIKPATLSGLSEPSAWHHRLKR